MKFYTDVHIPKEAVRQLRLNGVEIIHCTECDMDDAEDAEHLTYATDHGYIMVSCDQDFENLHWQWVGEEKPHGGIVYFKMPEQCESIGFIVMQILFIVTDGTYETDILNKLWRA